MLDKDIFFMKCSLKKLECSNLLRLCTIIIHIAILYAFYYIGTIIQQFLHIPIPGSVIGLLLLFTLLVTKVIKATWIEEGARFMMNNLVLFFIPATVGIINYSSLFTGKGILLIIIAVISTAFVMVSSGLTSQWIHVRKGLKNE